MSKGKGADRKKDKDTGPGPSTGGGKGRNRGPAGGSGKAVAGTGTGRRWGRTASAGSLRVMAHLKVLFSFLIWVTLIRQQASLMVDWRLYYAQALVACAALAVGSVMVVYMYPPRTARWRTVAWAFLASSLSGALVYAALGGRAGLLGALFGGALVLWARAEERGRRAVRRVRQARRT
ncbi:hypothetical protein ACH4F6_21640 [Streptomyces sp. NPDC017936]|uniref:hypothetical protein n=1 Tax=Streptomyces sp. NPDC017936 TaxID=3365016 RepID=UPI0037A9C1A1